MHTIDLSTQPLRELNATLQSQAAQTNATEWEVLNPRGAHAIAVGLDAPIDVTVRGVHRVLLRRHEQAGDNSCHWLCRAGRCRKHDVRHRRY